MTKAWREEEGRHSIGNTDIVQVVVDLLQGSLVLGSDGRPGPGEGVRRRGEGVPGGGGLRQCRKLHYRLSIDNCKIMYLIVVLQVVVVLLVVGGLAGAVGTVGMVRTVDLAGASVITVVRGRGVRGAEVGRGMFGRSPGPRGDFPSSSSSSSSSS